MNRLIIWSFVREAVWGEGEPRWVVSGSVCRLHGTFGPPVTAQLRRGGGQGHQVLQPGESRPQCFWWPL